MSENPLKKYFRQPAIHLALPSHGEFYKEGALSLPETGEAPVYPMTAMDEITYKTPDALFNGSATMDVIKSCVPAFVDPWEILTLDLNSVLIAIRIASVGDILDIDSTCPKCNEISTYEADLNAIADQHPDISKYHEVKSIGDLKLSFRPLTYRELNESNKVEFEEERITQILLDAEMSEEDKIAKLSTAFKDMSYFSVKSVSRSIRSIAMPDAVVTDPEHITEFCQNCERDVYALIRDHVKTLRSMEALKPLHVKCNHCEHEYDQPYVLDMTTFFDKSS